MGTTCDRAPFVGQHAGVEGALRLVIATCLSRDATLACLSSTRESAVNLWPSTLPAVVARAALRCPVLWYRVREALDASLQDEVRSFKDCPPAELASIFLEGRELFSGTELAGLLWTLLRDRNPVAEPIVRRLGLELELVAARPRSEDSATLWSVDPNTLPVALSRTG